MATPVSTREIVWAKWQSAFALVPKLLVLPAIVCLVVWFRHLEQSGFFGNRSDPMTRLSVYFMMLILWFAFGVFITSGGLWLATYVKQLGRAVGIAVTMYVAVAIGWMFLVMAVSNKDETSVAFAAGSPIFTAAFGTACIMGIESDNSLLAFCTAMIVWSLLYVVAAFWIYLVTLRSFNRKLGRITLKRSPPARR